MKKLICAKVIPMVLLHDLVEIDAGDTYAYDEAGADRRRERVRRKAADRIFGYASGRSGYKASGIYGKNLKHTRQRRRNLHMCWTIASHCFSMMLPDGKSWAGTCCT